MTFDERMRMGLLDKAKSAAETATSKAGRRIGDVQADA